MTTTSAFMLCLRFTRPSIYGANKGHERHCVAREFSGLCTLIRLLTYPSTLPTNETRFKVSLYVLWSTQFFALLIPGHTQTYNELCQIHRTSAVTNVKIAAVTGLIKRDARLPVKKLLIVLAS